MEGQGLAVLDLEWREEPSTLMVGVCCSLGVTSRLLASALMVSVCLWTEEDLRSLSLGGGLTLRAFASTVISMLLLLFLQEVLTITSNFH